ncbi:hypothetical protein ACU6U9_01445 [Pseudomonas sp. HK3]|jgi:hypothetical protein
MKNILTSILLLVSLESFAANSGIITSLGAAGTDSLSHKDIFQLTIEGGFNSGDCNSTFAAIRKDDTHLISLAMMAYATKTPVSIFLKETDIYHAPDNRCTIHLIYTN